MIRTTRTKALSWLLSLAMLFSLVPGMSLTAKAEGGVSYQEGSWSGNSVAYTAKTAANPTTLTSDTTAWGDGNWYVVPAGGVTISSRITVTGTVNLILTDGNTLTASKGITVAGNNTLNIYAQSEGDTAGSLLINSVDNYYADIGGVTGNSNAGTVNIHGGKITTKGGGNCAGIGGAGAGNGGNVTIYGGTIDATGNIYGAGIGGGSLGETAGNGGAVTIYGGTVTATGSADGGAGIGGGAVGGCGGTVTINGGTVTATGGPNSMGIGGVCGQQDSMSYEAILTPPKNGSLIIGSGLKVYGGDTADPTTEITQETLYSDSYAETTVYQYMIVSAPPHTHDGITFGAWTSTNSLPDTAGKYYLADNVNLSGTWTVPNTVDLCLNGKTIKGNNSSSVIIVASGSTLNLYDEEGDNGTITGGKAPNVHASPNDPSGGGVLVQDNGTFNMYGGTISGNSWEGRGTGAGVYVKGTFNMYGGSITKNSGFYGGGVLNNGTFNLSGGTITENSAQSYGGGVFHCAEKTFTVSGNPQITGNTANGLTSNVHIQNFNGVIVNVSKDVVYKRHKKS